MVCLKRALLVAMAVATCASGASAESITADVTADNHYALYSFRKNTFELQGHNEIGASGSPGAYNWSLPERYKFNPGDALYVAVWSDGTVAQGLLGDFDVSSLGMVLSGSPLWQVYGTGVGMGDGDAPPTPAAMAGYVAAADANFLWEAPYVGDPNGMEPWGYISGVSPDARWMWRADPANSNSLIGGTSGAEMLIFRLNVNAPIPSPGSAGVLACGVLVLIRRRRSL